MSGCVIASRAPAAGVVAEHDRGEGGPVERAVGGEHGRAELLDHRGEALGPGSHHLACQDVGVDDDGTQLTEAPGDGRLPRTRPAGQPRPQHDREPSQRTGTRT